MNDLQKLVEQWAREAGVRIESEWEMHSLSDGLYMDYACEVSKAVARLAIQYAAEEAAKVAENAGGLDATMAAQAIRERFKAV